MRPGDIVIVDSVPPHIASVMDETHMICEDGTVLPFQGLKVTKLYDALTIIKDLERGVLQQNEPR